MLTSPKRLQEMDFDISLSEPLVDLTRSVDRTVEAGYLIYPGDLM